MRSSSGRKVLTWGTIAVLVIVAVAVFVGRDLAGVFSANRPADMRQDISKALESSNPDLARLAGDSTAVFEVYPAAFLREYKIYRVQNLRQSDPVMFYVGYAPGKQVFVLTGSVPAYVSMARADELNISSADTAADYVATALEVTRSMSRNFYVVKSVDDVRFQGNLDAQQSKVKDDFIQKYRPVISAPKAQVSGDGYTVNAYAVMDQALQQYTVTVAKNGDMQLQSATLEKDLPLVFGL